MFTFSHHRKLDKDLKSDLKGIKNELLETTGKLIKMADYKL